MATEVAPKKRGRPKKTAITEQDEVVVLESTIDETPTTSATPVRKTRGKAVAVESGSVGISGVAPKKVSPAAASAASAASSRTAPSAAPKKMKDVEIEVPGAKKDAAATTATKKRTVKTSSQVSTPAAGDKAPSETTEPTVEKVEAQKPAPPSVKASIPPKPSSPPLATTKASPLDGSQPTSHSSASTVHSAPPPPPGVPVSEILRQADAFVRNSHDLNQEFLELATMREGSRLASTQLDEGVSRSEHAMSQTVSAGTQHSASIEPPPADPIPPPHMVTKLPTTNPLFTSRPKYTLPYSTTTALASREQHQQRIRGSGIVKPPFGARSTATPTSTPTPTAASGEAPPPPKSTPKYTEMHPDQIKRDPKFRELSSRWTRLLVALPVAIVTTYYLYQRWDEQRLYEEAVGQGRAEEWMDKMRGRARGKEDQAVAGVVKGKGLE